MPRLSPAPLRLSLLLLLSLSLALGACGRKSSEEDLIPPPAGDPKAALEVQVPEEMVIPAEVAKSWKSVVLEVTDKETRKVEAVEIKIGATAPLGSSGLTAQVEGFLPTFAMQEDKFTSITNDLNNPAARVRITDKDGKQLWRSFLFALYPTTHPFDHPRYSVTLKDYKKN